MPTHVTQWAGIAVTATVAFGCDANLFIAMPLGIFAGTLATILIALGERTVQTKKLVVKH